MKLEITVSAPIVGSLIPKTENPFVSAPIGQVKADVRLWDCEAASLEVKGMEPTSSEPLRGFWSRLADGLNLSLCARLTVDSREADSLPSLGVYSGVSSALTYEAGRRHGELMDWLEIVELASYADPIVEDPSLGVLLSSLRYSSITGKIVVYRNVEEHSILGEGVHPLKVVNRVKVEGPRLTRGSVGGDVYGALTHLVGVAVLESSVRFREGAVISEVVEAFRPLNEGVTLAVWGLEPREGCLWIPGMPGFFELACKGGG